VSENKPCPDCGAAVGEHHHHLCDVQRCPVCGGQYISCCGVPEEDIAEQGLEFAVWTGEWPGVAECKEYGWYCIRDERWGWLECGEDMPGAVADLNRLYRDAVWDAKRGRFVVKKSWVVSVNETNYGSAIILAETKEEAEELALDVYNEGNFNWHNSSLGEFVAKEDV